jgi:hypothetical protein
MHQQGACAPDKTRFFLLYVPNYLAIFSSLSLSRRCGNANAQAGPNGVARKSEEPAVQAGS